MQRLRVLLAEPDAPTRAGIRIVLEDDGFEVGAEPRDGAGAVAAALSEQPDVCLIDARLAGDAVAVVREISRRLPAAKILMLSESDDPAALFAAVRAGACGCVRTDLDPRRLPATLRGVLAGEAALSRRMTYHLIAMWRMRERGRMLRTVPGRPPVTDRELEVLELLAQGLRTSEVAARLAIADVTVRRHIASVVAKLGVDGRESAIRALAEAPPAGS